MRRRATTLLGLLAAVVVGATLLHDPIAAAAQLVDARIIGPLDGQGNVRVHEQGTANVRVASSSVPTTLLSDQNVGTSQTADVIDTQGAKEIRILATSRDFGDTNITGICVRGQDAQGNFIGMVDCKQGASSMLLELPPPKIEITLDGSNQLTGFSARLVVYAHN